MEWRSSSGARDVSCAWFGGQVLSAAFAAVFARRQVRLRLAFAILFSALKDFSLLESGFASAGSFRILKTGHISCACRAFFLEAMLPRRMFSLAECRVDVICCELCVFLESVLQNILLNDCCRRAVCALTRCFRGCVLLRMSGLLGDLMNYLLRPIAVVLLSCCATPCCVC